MKKKLFTLLFLVLSTTCFAQIDSTIFKGTLTNKEYNVYLKIDFYDQNIKVPGQEIFGDMAGFFGDYKDGRYQNLLFMRILLVVKLAIRKS